jgi:succinate dehydrogenase / fumarate reductase cytochrome b subunit
MAATIESFNERYHFLIRRLHSLSGIIPLGAFLCFHMAVNASIIMGPNAFQFAVDRIRTLENLGIVKAVEVCFILIPIVFHAIVGFVIWLSGRSNVQSYPHGDNIRYTLQRWTGIIAFVFIVMHLWHVHWVSPSGGAFDPSEAAGTMVTAMAKWWTGPVYAIGVLCAVFHLANGIWTFLISWGITIGPRSQMISGRVCAVIGVAVALLGMGALVRIKTMDITEHAVPGATGAHTTVIDISADVNVS